MQPLRERLRDPLHLGDGFRRQRNGRRDRRGVAGMAPRLLDVFENRADGRGFAVRHAIDVELGGVRQELVDEDRPSLGDPHRLLHVFAKPLLAVADGHAASAQNETRTNEHWIANPGGDFDGVPDGMGDAARRLAHAQFRHEAPEEVAILGKRDVARRCAQHPDSGLFETRGEIERGLAAELDDRAVAPLALVDLHHVLERQRLEVEPVARVVIRRNRLRVGVDHHDLDAAPAQRKGGMAAAPVELDALPDAVRPTAEDHDLANVAIVASTQLAIGIGNWQHFHIGNIRIIAVVIRRLRLELAGAGIDLAEFGPDAKRHAHPPHRRFVASDGSGDLAVAEAEHLGLAQQFRIDCRIAATGVTRAFTAPGTLCVLCALCFLCGLCVLCG